MGKTLHPYSRHLRVLNLRNLDDLLRDAKFSGNIASQFFSDGLAKFHHIAAKKRTRATQLDVVKIVEVIGEEVTRNAPFVEELSDMPDPNMVGVVSNALILSKWAPRLGALRSLKLWDGHVLADETVRNLLYAHCPALSTLRIYRCSNDDADSTLANFISGMAENSLVEFQNFNNCHVGAETCLAFNHHGKSLSTLSLVLSAGGVPSLSLLQGCKSLETLALECLVPAPDLKATQNDTYLEIVEWLQNCHSLKDITFKEFQSAPDILLPVLLNKDVSLTRLEITALKEAALYIAQDHHDFHQALGKHLTLQELTLAADADLMARDGIEIVTDSLCSLTSLRDLRLTRISDHFSDQQYQQIAHRLSRLEILSIGGYGISDAVLPELAQLSRLQLLAFGGTTTFTTEGVLNFIEHLGENNANMTLSMLYADPENPIDPQDLEMLRERMLVKVNGRLEYTLLRGEWA